MEIKEYVKIRKELLKNEIDALTVKPHLIIISLNEDEASKAYVKGKLKDGAEVGANVELIKLPENTQQEDLLKLIEKYNNDNTVHGMIVQMPLPKHISEDAVKNAIIPAKDVDGFNLFSKLNPCTPQGIINYLDYLKYDFTGKNAVVIGRSNIVGKPMAKLLLAKNCNVTQLHSRTKREDMEFYLEHADLIVVATGKKWLIDSSYKFKPSAYVIDVGINRENGVLYGDCEPGLKVALQTPVPGGVGLLTRLALLDNLMEVYKNEL
jgi:methylenetetrahydrofolate dehydrogenase (NADP+)/methenyltetrahydrofolate cyclohydrolase